MPNLKISKTVDWKPVSAIRNRHSIKFNERLKYSKDQFEWFLFFYDYQVHVSFVSSSGCFKQSTATECAG